MVVFVDLDDESEPPEDPRLRGHWDVNRFIGAGSVVVEKEKEKEAKKVDEEQRENPNRTPFTQALGCYP